jgi:hypothetical protein
MNKCSPYNLEYQEVCVTVMGSSNSKNIEEDPSETQAFRNVMSVCHMVSALPPKE